MKDLKALFHIHQTFTQNFICGLLLFFTVGIYLAVLGLGAGGGKPSSQRVSDIGNSALYAIFAIFGPFAGSIMNHLGPRTTMLLGILGYPIYVGGFFYYDKTGGQWFPILAGILLGFSAPLLWSVSGYIQWAYAKENEKGKYISYQYFLNQCGSVIGALVAFGIILKGQIGSEGSPTTVYIAFLVLMCLAFVVAMGLMKPSTVKRGDGTHIAVFHSLTWRQELNGMVHVLKDKRVLWMLPVIFSIEMPLAVVPALNGGYFSLRTRALNSVCFYAIALPSSVLVTVLTDKLPFGRRIRGLVAVSFVAVLSTGAWTALCIWVSLSSKYKNPPVGGVDWTSGSDFAGPFVLYMIFGVTYTMHQLIGLWVMGTFTNSPQSLAIFGGLFKGVAGGGLAVVFGMSSAKVKHIGIALFVLILQAIGFIIMFTLVANYVTETNYGNELDVIVPVYAEEKYDVHTVLADGEVIEGTKGEIHTVAQNEVTGDNKKESPAL